MLLLLSKTELETGAEIEGVKIGGGNIGSGVSARELRRGRGSEC